MKIKVLVSTHQSNLDKEVGPGNGTFANELLSRMKNVVDLKYLPYNNIMTSMISAYKIQINGVGGSTDIIHDIDGNSLFPLSKELYKKFIFTLHDMCFFMTDDVVISFRHEKNLGSRIWQSISQYSIKDKIKNAAAIITVGSHTKQLLIDDKDIEEDRIFVINHGVSNRFRPSLKKHDKFVVGTLSNLNPNKNPLFIIDSFRRFNDMLSKKEQKEIRLDLYGSLYSNEIEKIIKNKTRDLSNVRLMGPVRQEDKPSMYNSLDVFMFPSIWEGFGMPIIEAQASGLPVIIRGDSLIPEEVKRHCYRPYTHESAADIIYQLYKHSYNKTLRERSMKHAQGFTWEKAIEKHLTVYNQVLERRSI